MIQNVVNLSQQMHSGRGDSLNVACLSQRVLLNSVVQMLPLDAQKEGQLVILVL